MPIPAAKHKLAIKTVCVSTPRNPIIANDKVSRVVANPPMAKGEGLPIWWRRPELVRVGVETGVETGVEMYSSLCLELMFATALGCCLLNTGRFHFNLRHSSHYYTLRHLYYSIALEYPLPLRNGI